MFLESFICLNFSLLELEPELMVFMDQLFDLLFLLEVFKLEGFGFGLYFRQLANLLCY